MKKIIIGFSGILLIAFIVIMVANAKNSTREVNKPATELSMDCAKCPSASACGMMAETKTLKAKDCDPAKCKELGCDPTTCKAIDAAAKGEDKKCPASAMCPGSIKK